MHTANRLSLLYFLTYPNYAVGLNRISPIKIEEEDLSEVIRSPSSSCHIFYTADTLVDEEMRVS